MRLPEVKQNEKAERTFLSAFSVYAEILSRRRTSDARSWQTADSDCPSGEERTSDARPYNYRYFYIFAAVGAAIGRPSANRQELKRQLPMLPVGIAQKR